MISQQMVKRHFVCVSYVLTNTVDKMRSNSKTWPSVFKNWPMKTVPRSMTKGPLLRTFASANFSICVSKRTIEYTAMLKLCTSKTTFKLG